MIFIADFKTKEIIRAYDADEVDIPMKVNKFIKLKILQPITYLLNSEAKIVWKYVGTKKVRPTMEEIFTAITNFL